MVGTLFQIAGSLGLFLFGMKVMSDGIQTSAGERLQAILNYMTANRFTAVLTGFVITSIVQSSSATTVMVVSFVNAGLLSLAQAIGVIMGANIGTTVTGWIVALLGFKVNIAGLALPAIAVGLPVYLSKKLDRREWGETLIGFGLLFMALKFLKESVPDIKDNPEILSFLTSLTGMGFASYVVFVLTGAVLTFILQSSSAAMAITLTMAYNGWIDFPTAAAIVLGENIGTTITANLAAYGTNANARRAARAHSLFNIVGVIWISIVFRPFIRLVDFIVPGAIVDRGSITSHLAMFHSLFNVCNTLVLVGFVSQFSRVVERFVKEGPKGEDRVYRLKYISTGIQDTPEINIMYARQEIRRMAEIVQEMFSTFIEVFQHPKTKLGKKVQKLKEMEDYTDQMQEQISQFLLECLGERLSAASVGNVNAMIRIVDELESIGDSCYNLILLAERRYQRKMAIPREAVAEIAPCSQYVLEFLEFNKRHIDSHPSRIEIEEALRLERSIDQNRNAMQKLARKRLKRGSNVRTELLFLDMVKHIEHIGDFSFNISQALRDMSVPSQSSRPPRKTGADSTSESKDS